jgi:DNA-binding transcriptional MerR regulator
MSEFEDSRNTPSDNAFEIESIAIYTIETVERLTHISKDRIVLYYQHGLITSVRADEKTDLLFDDEAIHKLRRIAFLASEYGMNHDGLRVFSSLVNELERLREEVRFLRER